MRFDPELITKIIRETAETEILPRFQNLSKGDVSEKSPGDLVTIADIESEKILSKRLTDLLPGSLAIGEEGVAADIKTLKFLSDDKPVWIIDPVDGTHNFAHNVPCFAVIVCLVIKGKTVSGWIHDPIANTTLFGEQGAGAWYQSGELNGEESNRIHINPAKSMHQMIGSLKRSARHNLDERRANGETGLPSIIKRYRSVGREYMDLARGKFDFASYSGSLKPWDHAAGIMIYKEAGGLNAMLGTGNPYQVGHRLIQGEVMLAPNQYILDALPSFLK
jgi:fructose-1,6-bisphosphatase/inositol monophosphatase family enzyme